MAWSNRQILALACAALVGACAHPSQANFQPTPYASDLETELPEFAKLIWLTPAARDYDWFGFSEGETELLEFRKVSAGHYDVVFLGEEEDEVMLRSVEFWRTPDPNIVIMAVPSDTDPFDDFVPTPVVMMRSTNGSWVWCPELDHEGELISGSIDSHLRAVAERQGIELNLGDQDQDEAGKPPTANQYLTLFSDAYFLGGWKLARNNCLRLLPAVWAGFAKIEGRNTYSTGFFELQSVAFPIESEQLALPNAFEGVFTDPDRGKVTITTQQDGSYLIEAQDRSWLFSSRSLKLLPLERPGTYLGLAPAESYVSESEPWLPIYYIFVIEISDDGDTVIVKMAGRDYQRITEVQNGYSELLQSRVVTSYGLRIGDWGRIIGEIEPDKIQDLFDDPAFLVTLETKRDHSLHLKRIEPTTEVE